MFYESDGLRFENALKNVRKSRKKDVTSIRLSKKGKMVASNSTIMNSNDGDNDDIDKVQAAATEFKKKYEIKERLGKGLSSVVYVCVDKHSGKEYAVKVMDVSEDHINADGQNIVQQIHQEIRLLRLVEGHQFIIELVEVFESSAYIFLVFELCQNNDLFEYLSANVSLSEKRCRAIMKQIFEAVYHCHKVIAFKNSH